MMRELEPTVFIVDGDVGVLKSLDILMDSVRLRTEMYLSAEDFFRSYDRAGPGCLILEDRLPGIGGLGAYRRLRETGDNIPVIFLTAYGTVATAVRTMQEGAFDFLEKPPNDQYLIDRVQAALAQDRENLRQEAEKEEMGRRFQRLSPRERTVLDQLVGGRTSKAIARNLGIEPKTVDVHRANIMRKVGVGTTAGLVYLALTSGYSGERPLCELRDYSPATL